MILYTIGFSQKSAEEFFKIVTSNHINRLIDVRLNNKSQLAGFTNVKHLPYFLNLHNIKYLYRPEFAPTKELLNGYKNKSISWRDYEVMYSNILTERNIITNISWNIFDNAVLLCSEPTADKCHRRLLAEYLAQRNHEIEIKHV